MKRGLRLTKKQKTEQAPPPQPKATRTSRYAPAPQAVPDMADEDGTDELDEASTGWQQTTVKLAGLTRMVTVVVWILVLAGPLLAFFAIAVASSSRATTATQTQSRADSAPSATGPSGFAELYVAAYLAAGEGTEDDLLPYYSEPVTFANEPGSRSASRVVTVAAEQVEKGYWSVTVAARVSAKNKAGKMTDRGMHYYRVGVQVSGTPEAGGTMEPSKPAKAPAQAAPSSSASGPAPASAAASPTPAGSASPAASGGPVPLYAATSLPAEVNAPASASHGALDYGSENGSRHDDAVSDTVSRFLSAYLTGRGELNRYVSPGLQVAAISPAPYESTLVTGLQDDAPEDEDEDDTVPQDGTQRHVLVSVSATTGGQDYLLSYALTLTTRDGRWEVASFDSAPALSPEQTGPVADETESAPDASSDESSDASADTAGE
ncbi:conjugal transfer protein [Streptomyces drozdowiczii]|uniref:Conjugal transfer protein n=1 Tax=Streptomyces drozdowiczii TaxID=202862 RepID=A0ABY6PU24_9ACTN|nr:conjugal transfer protein [Streptomyces drozdowiczii]MCX0244606.1 conjugal transfer protein [Streptomyces drozdowiczii]UZK55646.1 conjugal transfer protein [Streptomyces drozdowiczii]